MENRFHLSKTFIWMCKKKKIQLHFTAVTECYIVHVSSERHNRFIMTCQQYKICFQKPFTLISLLIKTALKFTQEQCTQNVDSVLQFDATDILNITWQVYKTIENFWIYLKIGIKFTQEIINFFEKTQIINIHINVNSKMRLWSFWYVNLRPTFVKFLYEWHFISASCADFWN